MDYKTLNTSQIIYMLGSRFKDYRLRLGLTQKEISEKTGLSIATIHKFETGTAYNLSFATLFRFLKAIEYTDGIDGLLPELPASPYMTKNKKRVQRIKHIKNHGK